ncbi:MAG: hypothetical protein J7465_11190 [Chloroflexus sp.]|nr:hypothetical protein [Chloroflexus sp.]MBO9373876.1 hypothetical protein [Chloroflexus sp.]
MYHPRGIHRLLLAAMSGLAAAIVPEVSLVFNEQSKAHTCSASDGFMENTNALIDYDERII